jgi:hypothetical protein
MEVIRMSISNEEWNAGRTNTTIEARIVAFLKQNNKPFTFWGIISGLGYNTNIKDFGTLLHGILDASIVQNALDKLVREGKVTSRIIQQPNGTETYYKAV